MQPEMSIAWWPALVFGWPGPILAVIFCVVGIVRAKVAWMIAAAVVLMPLSLYLGMNPRVQWGVALPVLPLIAAVAISRGSKPIAWLSLLLLTGMILWLAGIVFGERVKSRLSIVHILQSAVPLSQVVRNDPLHRVNGVVSLKGWSVPCFTAGVSCHPGHVRRGLNAA
jgi:hypothetical protein